MNYRTFTHCSWPVPHRVNNWMSLYLKTTDVTSWRYCLGLGPRYSGRYLQSVENRNYNFISSFIDLFFENKVLDFWEGSIQLHSVPFILTPSSLVWSPFPPLTITDVLSWAQGQQDHGEQEQKHLGRTHGISWCFRKLSHAPL